MSKTNNVKRVSKKSMLDVSLVEGIEIVLDKAFNSKDGQVETYKDKKSKLLVVNKFDNSHTTVEEFKKEGLCGLRENTKELLFSLAFSWNLDRKHQYDIDLGYWTGEVNSQEDVLIAVISQMTADAYNFYKKDDETIDRNIKILSFINIDEDDYITTKFEFKHQDYVKMFEWILNMVKYDWNGECDISKSNVLMWNYMENVIVDEIISYIEYYPKFPINYL